MTTQGYGNSNLKEPFQEKTMPSIVLSKKLGQWIAALYQHAQMLPVAEFKPWCFSALNEVIEFDSGLWATRSDVMRLNVDHWVEDTFVHNQPAEFMANYAAIAARSQTTDNLNQHLMANPERFMSLWQSCPKQQWLESQFYLEHCQQFKVENAISAITMSSEHSVIGHVFSFYRAQRDNDFCDDDILLANFALPHLVEAFRINVLSSFGHSTSARGAVRAVVDRFGEIIEAEEGFYHLMKDKDLLQGSRLTIAQLAQITASEQLNLQGLVLTVSFSDGVLYLEACEASLVDRLTTRQKEVCQLMIKGLTNQDIADCMPEIKLNTVQAHLRNILKTLKVSSRAAATAYLIRQGFHQ
ncbi:MAG: DNA-binding NarL/FixJ family response regulator [Phenylobacterium sp.]